MSPCTLVLADFFSILISFFFFFPQEEVITFSNQL